MNETKVLKMVAGAPLLFEKFKKSNIVKIANP